MRTTKSGKVILNSLQTFSKSIDEANNAVEDANKQIWQVPLLGIWRIFGVIATVVFMCCIVRFSGYVTGQVEEKPQPAYSCPIAHCPMLPETGAN